jgi:hypothetical protein
MIRLGWFPGKTKDDSLDKPRLITLERGVDVIRPAVNSACEIEEILKTVVSQLADGVQTSDAVMAVNDDFAILEFLQFIDAKSEFAERDQGGIRKVHDVVFLLLADIEQQGRIGRGEPGRQIFRAYL